MNTVCYEYRLGFEHYLPHLGSSTSNPLDNWIDANLIIILSRECHIEPQLSIAWHFAQKANLKWDNNFVYE